MCGETVKSGTVTSNKATGTTRTVYRCRSGKHLARAAEPVDELVTRVVLGRLARPDAAGLLDDTGTPDAAGMHLDRAALMVRLDDAAGMFAAGDITAAQLRAATKALRAQVAEIETAMAATSRGNVLAELVAAKDVEALWDRLPLARRRAVVDTLVKVTLLSSGRRGNRFDPELVRIEWRTAA